MLSAGEIHANIPAADLSRARAFYTQTLGLEPSHEDDNTLTFPTPGGSWFQVYLTSYAGTGKHTIAQWEVGDLAAEVDALKSKGVAFERYDLPGVSWDGDIASVEGLRMAWFLDSEGNVLCLDERTAAAAS